MIREEFLDNNIKVYQDDELYTFTSDSILLSKFAIVKKGDVVADFCAGSGVVGLNLLALNTSLIKSINFFEMQTPLFNLCKKSIEENGLSESCVAVNTKLQDIDKSYNEKFSLIVCNPPYMKVGHGDSNQLEQKAVCKSEITLSLQELCASFNRCLKFGGRVCLVHRADRLVEVITELKNNNIEPKKLQLVCSGDKDPYLFMLEGVKGGKSGIKILNSIKN
ncbi:MAG: methyltransferase [Clostridia bacterium]|nr:methyltransferase [Clostridia bacterium]